MWHIGDQSWREWERRTHTSFFLWNNIPYSTFHYWPIITLHIITYHYISLQYISLLTHHYHLSSCHSFTDTWQVYNNDNKNTDSRLAETSMCILYERLKFCLRFSGMIVHRDNTFLVVNETWLLFALVIYMVYNQRERIMTILLVYTAFSSLYILPPLLYQWKLKQKPITMLSFINYTGSSTSWIYSHVQSGKNMTAFDRVGLLTI